MQLRKMPKKDMKHTRDWRKVRSLLGKADSYRKRSYKLTCFKAKVVL